MTHTAIQEALEGKSVSWLQKVTDEEYLAGPHADAQEARAKGRAVTCGPPPSA